MTGALFALVRRQSTGVRLNTLLTTAGTAASLLSSLVMRLVIARAFGPGALGLYAIALGYQRVAGQIADGGLHYALLRRASGDQALLRQGISLKMLFGLTTAIAAATPSLSPWLDPGLRVAILLGAAGVLGWSQLDCAQVWLRSHSRFSGDLALHASMSGLRVVAAIAVLLAGGGVPLALATYFVVPVLATFVVPRPWPLPGVPFAMLRDSAASFTFRVLWLLWLNLDLLMLGLVLDLATVGAYEAPRSLAYPVLAIADGAAVAALQHIGSGRGTVGNTKAALVLPALIGVLLAPVAGLISQVALSALFGPAFAAPELAAVFTLLYAGFIAASAAMPYASALLFSRPRTVLVLTAIDVVVAAVLYAAVAHAGVVAVAAAACALQGANLAALVLLARTDR
jgi:O-antigen/teichoic acid export membrane protein